jgi:outer membrane usher protein
MVPIEGQSRDYFNPHALEIDNPNQSAVDLTQFAEANSQAPGTYRVSVYINGEEIDARDVAFVAGKDGKLSPQLTPADFASMGVRVNAFPALKALPPTRPVDISQYIPSARTTLVFNRLRLDVSIPQAALDRQAQGAVDPKLWDQGVPALLLNYSLNGSNTQYTQHGGRSDAYYANLRSGLNLGPWRLRNYSTYTYNGGDQGSHSQFNSINTYLQRDIQSLKGQLTLGDSYTPSDVLDSVQFRGVQLTSDDNMLPDSLRGFAPVIRGIARSNAKVTVKQNGYVIYQSYVAPGAFTINDLYPTASSGDLNVTITEADGSERAFSQPFSAVPIMQREGRLKYGFAAGKYRSWSASANEPTFGQATLLYGLPHAVTVYGGGIAAQNYDSVVGGLGIGLGELGSLSADATYAAAQLRNKTHSTGQSYRVQYAKDVQTTGTTFTLAAYRYSTRGFYSFQETNDLTSEGDSDVYNLTNTKRQKLQLNVSQSLQDYGSVYLSAYQQDYWRAQGYERSLSAGYNTNYDGISYGLAYTYSQSPGAVQSANQQFAFNVQVPLSRWLSNNNAWASYSVNTDNQGRSQHQVGLNGTALEDNNLSYGVQESYGNRGQGNTGSLTADYRGTYGEVNGGYNYSGGSRQVNYGLQGSLVAHEHGLTLGQTLGDAVAIVRAPGVSGATIQGNTGVKTDWRGYALVPYVSPYKKNRIALDTTTLGEDADVDMQTQTVVPTKGAVVMADFKTRIGRRVLMSLVYQGKPVPFGATASPVGDKTGAGIVGEGGQVYLTGLPDSGQLQVKWGHGDTQQCTVSYQLPVRDDTLSPGIVSTLGSQCR